MSAVEAGRTVVAGVSQRRLRQFVHVPTEQVAPGVATERVTSQQHDIDQQHEGPDADAELLLQRHGVREQQRQPDIVGQDDDEDHRDVEEVAVDVLPDERE